MADIQVVFQAINDTEVETNTIKNNQGVITLTDTKILLGLGNTTLDYLTLLKNEIMGGIKVDDVPIIYQGTKTTNEIDTNRETMKNSLVFNTDDNKLYYVKKEQTETDFKVEIPLKSMSFLYAERYIAGNNITISDNLDGTKTISAYDNQLSGIAVRHSMPDESELTGDSKDKIFFIM